MALDLPPRQALGRSDFMVSASNAAAVARIEATGAWPGGRLALAGPARSGKTHLVQVWRGLIGAEEIAARELDAETALEIGTSAPAVAVEDGERIAALAPDRRRAAEAGLFHLHNALAERGRPLLLTGNAPPARWGAAIPDLASRLQAIEVVEIGRPDDALLSCLVVKLAADRQLTIAPDLLTYIVRRIERSFASAEGFVAALDRQSMARRRGVTRTLVNEVLAAGHGAREGD